MPRPARIQYEHAYYHVMNRGRGRRWIYHGSAYYEAFLRTLEEAYERFDARIHAYCLMGNHYHLLVETPLANLDRIMRHINGVYTQQYNRLKRTDGPLFRGRYKSLLIDESAHLLQVSRYIHRNPAEIKGATDKVLDSYMWSSYLAFIKKSEAPDWLVRSKTYQLLGGKHPRQKYRSFVLLGNDPLTAEFYSGDSLTGIFGDKTFRQSVYDEQENFEAAESVSRLVGTKISMGVIVHEVASMFSVSEETLVEKQCGHRVQNLPRKMAMYIAKRDVGFTQKEIAHYFHLNNAGSVSSAIRSIELAIQGDLRSDYDAIKSRLNIVKLT